MSTLSWDEALDVLEASARGGRPLPFAPPAGPLPARLRGRAQAVLAALRAAESAAEVELARVGGELSRLRADGAAAPRSVDRAV